MEAYAASSASSRDHAGAIQPSILDTRLATSSREEVSSSAKSEWRTSRVGSTRGGWASCRARQGRPVVCHHNHRAGQPGVAVHPDATAVYRSMWVPNGLVVRREALFVPYVPRARPRCWSLRRWACCFGDMAAERFPAPQLRRRLVTPLRFVRRAVRACASTEPAGRGRRGCHRVGVSRQRCCEICGCPDIAVQSGPWREMPGSLASTPSTPIEPLRPTMLTTG
jgi:hypothetical protein